MATLVRHPQTKGPATDKLNLNPPRHLSTLPSLAPDCGVVFQGMLDFSGRVLNTTASTGPLTSFEGSAAGENRGKSTMTRKQETCDHFARELVPTTGEIQLANRPTIHDLGKNATTRIQ